MISNRVQKLRKAERCPSNCRDQIAVAGDYLTNRLSKPERVAFDTHLNACPDCRAFLATYQKTIELTRSFLRSCVHEQQQTPLHCER